MSRVIVIGAGAGGLATAARLAVKGHTVQLFEASPHVGGKLATYRRDGFAFDTGPSLFTLPAVYRDLFMKTGRPLEEEVDLQEVEPAFGYHFADGTTATVPGVDPARCAMALQDAFGG
ncbi:MAG: NAD(P)-binding protein, partial [Actinomycetota bacterium]|nr:NAD(P)-binding protein [Actinomycetota bacterium]